MESMFLFLILGTNTLIVAILIFSVVKLFKRIAKTESIFLEKIKAVENEQSKLFKGMKEENSNQILSLTENLNHRLDKLSLFLKDIKLDNLVNTSNEISRYRDGYHEDEFYITEADYKINKIKDKKSNELTQVFYKNGLKAYTETYKDDALRHQLSYTEDGMLEIGKDYNISGQLEYEYVYDQAGEITEFIEYVYDDNGTLSNTIKKEY